ncbi:MAG TPA: type II toxin-antitoxin system RelE/ParE family toxin [Tepidisphaeraceae bacterium]|jgi:addiction module RelE/StbE family toxin|nr:type II toxin-antitoxin system RelE/ParE family toxin [Tepidisphaeraceae bacterium]
MAPNFRVRLTRQALSDLEEIFDFISKDSPQNAASMIERIFDSIDLLEIFPHRTVVERQASALKYPVRSLPVKPYVIYFRVIENEGIVVVRHIRHGSREKPETV